MRYVVQFCTRKDRPQLLNESAVTMEEERNEMTACEPLEDVSIDDLPEEKTIKGGLQGKDGKQIPLESVYVKARLMDLAAQVIIFQTYKNDSLIPIEAKYVFPLDSTATVCGFEAFINGKHIVGEVKEKQQARREYRTAIREGHGAYLMDQDAPDVFTVSVGNLPAGATVIIKITYVSELIHQSSSSCDFSIPGTLTSWQEDQALKENTQDTVEKVGIDSEKAAQCSFHLEMSIEMPRKIEEIYCFSHTIKLKKTDNKAVIRVEEGTSLADQGFSMMIALEMAYIPRMWVETHPDKDSEACMLIFQPEFENVNDKANITIVLDCSNSMEYCFQTAKKVALLAVSTRNHLPINVITFGSTYKELYFYPQKNNNYDTSEMEAFVKMAKPNMGNTEFWKPLQSLCLLRPSSGRQKILLISDGHLQDDHLVLQILKKNKDHINLLTCGVGAKANKHMLRCLAKHGAGAFEYFGDKSKSSWRSKMDKQHDRLQSPSCTSASIKWRQFGRHLPELVQAPANIQSIFYGDCLIVYGFVSHCTQAALKALIENKEFENMVSTTELQKTTGTMLHKLTARAVIRDYEDGILREKEHENEMEKQKMKSFIIELSKEHSIITEFTSFVAIEKRSAEESENIQPNIDEIISAENVDILPYMEYTEGGREDEAVFGGSVEADEELHDLQDAAEEDDGRSSSSRSLAIENDEDFTTYGCADADSDGGDVSLGSADADSDGDEVYLGSGARLREYSSSPSADADSDGDNVYLGSRARVEEKSSSSAMRSLAVDVQMMAAPASLMSKEDLPEKTTSAPPRFGIPETFGSAMSADAGRLPGSSGLFGRPTGTGFGFGMPVSAPCFAPPLQTETPNLFGLPPAMSNVTGTSTESSFRFGFGGFGVNAVAGPTSHDSLFRFGGFAKDAVTSPATEPSLRDRFLARERSEDLPQYSLLLQSQSSASAPIPKPRIGGLFGSSYSPTSSSGMAARRRVLITKAARCLLSDFTLPSWTSLSPLQSQEGYWLLTPQLGTLLNIDVPYFCDIFLAGKGISSLGSRGKEEILKLIATLLVLQVVRTRNLLTGIKFKALMKLDECDSASESFTSIEKAVNWAVRTDRQYPGICSRMGLGRDWEHITRQLLNIEPPSSDLSPALYH